MGWRALLAGVFIAVWSLCAGQTIDQIMTTAQRSVQSSEFIQDNSTVLVELDMVYTAADYATIQNDRANAAAEHGISKRKAVAYESKRWTNKVIPYYMANVFSSQDRSQIQVSFDHWMRYTCIKFRPGSSDRNYIYLQDGGGCSSYVGMSGGSQAVTLARGCRVPSVIIHELGHAVGFNHEQTRPDRDTYVTVYNGNIMSGMHFNFERYTTSYINSRGVPYDYSSVMHYGQYAFSANGRPTIITKNTAWQHKIGRAGGLSFRDVKLANIIYKCNSHCGSKSCSGEGFLDKNCVCQCPGNPVTPCGDGGGGGGGGGGGDEDCEDLHENCATWASQDYCTSSADYMLSYCALSCDECTDGGDGGGGGGGGNCEDQHTNCASWAGIGECSKNPSYMHESCAKSCDTCDDGGGGQTCKDLNDQCGTWSSAGYCRYAAYKAYMEENCARSCDVCGGASSDVGGEVVSSCTDDNPTDCPYWASIGECGNNPAYMRVGCRHSCGIC